MEIRPKDLHLLVDLGVRVRLPDSVRENTEEYRELESKYLRVCGGKSRGGVGVDGPYNYMLDGRYRRNNVDYSEPPVWVITLDLGRESEQLKKVLVFAKDHKCTVDDDLLYVVNIHVGILKSLPERSVPRDIEYTPSGKFHREVQISNRKTVRSAPSKCLGTNGCRGPRLQAYYSAPTGVT